MSKIELTEFTLDDFSQHVMRSLLATSLSTISTDSGRYRRSSRALNFLRGKIGSIEKTLLAGLFLLIMGLQVYHSPVVMSLSHSLSSLSLPLSHLLRHPIDQMKFFYAAVESYTQLIQENHHLKSQNQWLIHQLRNHETVMAQNQTLRQAFHLHSLAIGEVMGAHITHSFYNGQSHTYFVRSEGDLPPRGLVLSAEGTLLGRFRGTEQGRGFFIPVKAPGVNIPVCGPKGENHGIVKGQGQELSLRYTQGPSFSCGDILVTSGIEGTFPSGIPVAVVERVDESGGYLLAPYSSLHVSDLVFIVGETSLSSSPDETTPKH